MALIMLPIANAVEQIGDNYGVNTFFGSGGGHTDTVDRNIDHGLTQNYIGEYNNSLYTTQVGIFYLIRIGATTITIPAAPLLPFIFYIEEYGIEWVKINWT